ncbi:amidohydrolase [Peptoniphilus sp. KCTC 25270]|uniref:amidohydrolase n=1 Tax=Peptoniphilus sp. KCTC 25270 TaxID=2897414 RepID=UPI001E29D714|nr:amidohydrolase [Peptoniphilus sp. KCTC 25270]MCD1147983.1 amidohydrolase [Peptoniphilus sp. KCTC 25270]
MKQKFINGKVFLEPGKFTDTFVVEGEIFSSVGDKDAFGDEIIDLKGRTVIPGFNDSHLHIVQTGQNLFRVDLNYSSSIDEVIERGRKFLEEHPEEEVLYGRGWNQDYFTMGEKRILRREDLDRISTEIPILFERVCGHLLSANSKALEILEISAETEIDGGEIRRDQDGTPTGVFTENAIAFSKSIIPKDSKEVLEKKILEGMNYAIKNGLTSIQSCDYYEGSFEETVEAILNIYRKKKTKLRYEPQFNFQNKEAVLPYLETYYFREDLYNDTYTKGAWKLFKDGSLGAKTAEMLNGYKGDSENKGVEAIGKETLEEAFAFGEEKGIRVIVHAIGDGAVESVLEAGRKYNREGNSLRHGIVHCQITNQNQLDEIQRLGFYTLMQPVFLQYDLMILEDRVEEELAKTSYAFGTLYRMDKKRTSFGTDSPVEDLNPFVNLYHGITRSRQDGTPEGGFVPQEKMTLEEAVEAYTYGSACSQGMEGKKGRIKMGQYADFLLLKEDLFSLEPKKLLEMSPEAVYIGGEKVFERK